MVPRPYSIGKGDEDWCITHFNILPSAINSYYRSFLLIKNMDFDEFDANVEAKKYKCPAGYNGPINLKDSPNFRILIYFPLQFCKPLYLRQL